jgi:hypothetical protein
LGNSQRVSMHILTRKASKIWFPKCKMSEV